MKGRLFTIKEVAGRTGLSTQLIRKWEERYDAVKPQRLPNGYRYYTEADIETLAWLKSRVDEGMPIAMAVKEKRGGYASPPENEVHEAPFRPKAAGPGADRFERDLREPALALLDYFERLDLNGALQFFDRLLELYRIEHVLSGILQPALLELGERWSRGDISEYQEHFGSYFIRDKILSMRNLFRPAESSPLIVTACGPGERHELGILFVGFYALRHGFRVIYLGPSPAEKGLFDCLKAERPSAFAFSFSSEERMKAALPFLLAFDETIRDLSPATCVFIGGNAVKADGVLEGTGRTYLLEGEAARTVKQIALRLRRTAD